MTAENINDTLGRTPTWKHRRCKRCEATPREARLNIEGVIHHGAALECVDRKQCGRRVKSASLSPTNRHTRTRDKALVLRLQREVMAGLDARCPDTGRGVVSASWDYETGKGVVVLLSKQGPDLNE